MNRRSKIQLIKYILYSFLMIVLYVLQTDPNFTLSSGTGPVLVLPFAVAVAMFDGQLAGGLFGLFAGILCDTFVQRPVWIWLDFISGHLYGSGIAGALLHATLADQQFNFYRQRVCGSAAIGILFLLCNVGI